MKLRTVVIAASCLCLPRPSANAQVSRERVRSNDNRARAGILSGKTLALRMEARLAEWHPDGDDKPGAVVPVFAEIGRQASIPGPLIRVPAGTDIITVVRNAVPNTILTLHGLHSRPAIGAAFNDSVQLAYGQIQTLRFRLDRPGTYYYWGTTTGRSLNTRAGEDAQLTGAIVVDEADERPSADRILVIGSWTDSAGTEANRHRSHLLFVMNGRSWPQTDRLVYERGDTVRWRVINASADIHPMHLHGHYFRVRRRGDARVDTVFGAKGDMENTERMLPGETMYVTWLADKVGGWLFHCHIPEHIARRGPLGYALPPTLAQAGEMSAGNMSTDMGGLVAAIEVKPAEEDTTPVVAIPPAAPRAREIRMLIRPNAGSTPRQPLYDVAFDQMGLEPSIQPDREAGPPLVLTRGEPVSITIVNRLTEPTSIHWHGIELASYFDGVPGISGVRPQLAPAVAPGDSFQVHFTPQRAGTFMYHTHLNEMRQQRGGLAGPLLVVERGKYDPNRDVSVLISSPSDSLDEDNSVLINGSLRPASVVLRRGTPARLRLMNITTLRPGVRIELHQDTLAMNWRVVAKDGMDKPVADRFVRPARTPLSIGETMDVEFTPMQVGDLKLDVRTVQGVVLGTLPIRVQ
ncbi:MAG TPA: multicopper oxidase domain-containing protein [Gemmatimonadaceae bacterium]|nr:multicopper oxidase domain-containing protein [Gemmatimonadaceae bacterium]